MRRLMLTKDKAREIVVGGKPWGWMTGPYAVRGERSKQWEDKAGAMQFASIDALLASLGLLPHERVTCAERGPDVPLPKDERITTVALATKSTFAVVNARFYDDALWRFPGATLWLSNPEKCVRVVDKDGPCAFIMPLNPRNHYCPPMLSNIRDTCICADLRRNIDAWLKE